MALAVLRLIGEEVRKERTTRVVAQLPVDVSTFLINEKREWLHRLESSRAIDIVLVPDPNMQTPNYSIRRVRDDELSLPENAVMSHQVVGTAVKELDFQSQADKQPPAAPAAVQQIAPAAPAPIPAAAAPVAATPGPGFWGRLKWLFTGEAAPAEAPAAEKPRREDRHGGRPHREHRDHRDGRRPQRGDRDRGPRRDREKDRDRDRDRDRNRNRDRDRHRDERGERQERPRGGEDRDDANRQRERQQADAQRSQQQQQQTQPQQQPQQQGAEGDSQRRRRRRGRGGRGRGRERQENNYRPTDTQPIAVPFGHEGRSEAAPSGMSAPAASSPPPAMEAASAPPPPPPPMDAPSAPKSGSTYTVWSSTPGESQHFGPKD